MTPALPFRSVKVVTECVVQLELVAVVRVLSEHYLGCLSVDNVTAIVNTLENSVEFARKFNADRRLREALWRSGFMRFPRRNKLPLLLRQETASVQQLLLLLQVLLSDESSAGLSLVAVQRRALAVDRLISLAQRMVQRVSDLDANLHAPEAFNKGVGADREECEEPEREMLREVGSYSPLLQQFLGTCLHMSDEQFVLHLPALYPLFVELTRCGSRDVRQGLHAIFSVRIAALLPLSASPPAKPPASAIMQ